MEYTKIDFLYIHEMPHIVVCLGFMVTVNKGSIA